jgi:hypothetical protein
MSDTKKAIKNSEISLKRANNPTRALTGLETKTYERQKLALLESPNRQAL